MPAGNKASVAELKRRCKNRIVSSADGRGVDYLYQRLRNYNLSEFRAEGSVDLTIINAIAFYPGIGPYLSTMGQAACDSDYENGAKGTLESAFFNFGPDVAGKISIKDVERRGRFNVL